MWEIFLCVFPRVKMRVPTAPAGNVQGLTGNQTSKLSLVARRFPTFFTKNVLCNIPCFPTGFPPWGRWGVVIPGAVGVQHAHLLETPTQILARKTTTGIGIPSALERENTRKTNGVLGGKMWKTFLCLFPRVKMRTPTAPAGQVSVSNGNQNTKMGLVARGFPLCVRIPGKPHCLNAVSPMRTPAPCVS